MTRELLFIEGVGLIENCLHREARIPRPGLVTCDDCGQWWEHDGDGWWKIR